MFFIGLLIFRAGRLLVHTAASDPVAVVKSPLPSLQSGLRLYLLVLIGSALLIVRLENGIDVTFLRFIAAIFIFVGFTALALLITRTSPGAIVGGFPGVPALIIGLLAGIALWVPGTWLLLSIRQVLTNGIGVLPPPITTSSVGSSGSKALLFVAIIPICEGLLFFGFLLAAARGIGNRRAILLIGLLFGIFGLFSDQFGMSAIPAYFLLGIVGASLTLWSQSIVPGILVLSGFNAAEPLIRDILFKTLLAGHVGELFGFPWLIAVALFGFLAFALTRIARTVKRQLPLPIPAVPGRLWWLPLLVVLVLTGTLIYGEVSARAINAQQQAIFTPSVTGNTAAPNPVAAPPSHPTP